MNLLTYLPSPSNVICQKRQILIPKKKAARPLLFLGVLFSFQLNLLAQKNTVAAGGTALGSGGEVSYSIGQIDYTTISNASISLSQGVQQAYDIQVLSGIAVKEIDLRMAVYPNPAVNNLILSVSSELKPEMRYELFDLKGALILTNGIYTNETILNIQNLDNGCYTLRILQQSKGLKTFKIIKEN